MNIKKFKYLFIALTTLIIFNMPNMAFAGKKVERLKATSSSFYNLNYLPSRAVDGSPSTFWIGASGGAPWWIMVDTGSIKQLEEMRFSWYYLYYSTNFDIQVSQDGETWENVHTGLIGGYSGSVFKMIPYELNREARYVRIYIHQVSKSFPIIPEIEVYSGSNIPRKIRFQGRLKDSSGLDVEGTLKLTFRIYDQETAGAPLWSEIQEGIVIEKGMLDIVLGNISELDLLFDRSYYLGVEVELDGEMSPRFEMTSVPYAIVAEE